VMVSPGAKQDSLVGWLDTSLKIRVAANPEKGKANKSVVNLLSKALAVPKTSIQIVSGATKKRKRVEIKALEEQEVFRRLAQFGIKK